MPRAPVPPWDTIPDRIRIARTRNGWTQAQVAGWTGISAAHIGQFEAGRVPSVPNLVRLAVGLRVKLDWLGGLDPRGPWVESLESLR